MRWLDVIADSMHEFEQASIAGGGQGSLVCCSPWGCKESDTTERLKWMNCNPLLVGFCPSHLSTSETLLIEDTSDFRAENFRVFFRYGSLGSIFYCSPFL